MCNGKEKAHLDVAVLAEDALDEVLVGSLLRVYGRRSGQLIPHKHKGKRSEPKQVIVRIPGKYSASRI